MPIDITHTLKASGGDYSLISTWESTEQRDLVAADETETLECYNEWPGGLDNRTTIDTWTTDITHHATIKSAAGNGHGGVSMAGFYISTDGSYAPVFDVNEPHFRFIGLELINVNANGRGFDLNNSSEGIIEDCLLKAGEDILKNVESSHIVRNVSVDGGRYGIQIKDFNQPTVQNATVVNCTEGVRRTSGSSTATVLTNIVAYGNTTDFNLINPGQQTYCATGDSTAVGTGAVNGVTAADFINFAGGDYNPAPAGKLDGAGSSPPVLATDIAGNSRNDPDDIGAYAIAGAAPPISIEFTGPDIADQTGTNSVTFSMSQVVSDSFTVQNGTASYALGPNSNALPPGLSVNSTTGNIEGTPTQDGTYANIIVRGNDAAAAGPVLQQNLWQDSDVAGTSGSVTFPVTPTSGSLLITALTVDKNSGAITIPAGWTIIGTAEFGNTVSGAFAYKISDGTEGAVPWNWINSEASHVIWISEYSGVSELDVSAEADSADVDVTSQTTGTTAANTADNSLAVAIWGADTSSNVDNGAAYTNGFIELHPFDPGALVGMAIATKILTGTAAVECTFTTTGTGDAMYGKVAVFK